jgi:uncharacterized RDD family membrane protein YckC
VYVFGTTEVQGFPVIAMELAPGGTLKDLLTDGTPLPFAAAVDAILHVVAGLEAAAAIGILHRDIKPSNCFVHGDGRVLVGDFGLSVATSSRGGSTTSPGAILGTPGFASPEQLRGEALDVRSDIYSVGATIFYLLAGRAPFDDQSTTALISRVATEPPPSLVELRPDVPRRLALLVAKCLAKKPDDRYPGYAALAGALEPFSSSRLKSAPLIRRIVAGAVDLYIAALPVIVLERYLGLPPLSTSHPLASVLVGLTALGVMTLYYGSFEGGLGATPAKALFGLRVVGAANTPPGIATGMMRALAFAVPIQVITRLATWLLLSVWPDVAVGFTGKIVGGISLVLLFSTARRSNGYTALHDRVTSTRVVLKRKVVEARERRDRMAAVDVPRASGETRIGPYLVPEVTAIPVASAISIEGHDDRLGRRVWIDLLPPGTPALSALRRDLGRAGRARWLTGRRSGDECWDAYEAIEGDPIHVAAAQPQPWSRVRHWLADFTREVTAGLDDGSLPALDGRRVWIDRDDRGRILDWTDPGSGGASSEPDAAPPDLQSAQRLLYAVSVGALLGIPADVAQDRQPDTPLPMPARKLLLSLGDGAFKSTTALSEGLAAALNAPAVFPKPRRAAQIGVCAIPAVLMAAVAVGVIMFNDDQKGLAAFDSPAMLWAIALGVVSGMLVAVVPFALFGALVMRGGFTFRGFGAAMVNRYGQPVSRFRALWRAIVTWSLVCALMLLFKGGDTATNIDPRLLILQTLGVGLVVAAAVWTVLHPSRSIQDRLSGTWIVPR